MPQIRGEHEEILKDLGSLLHAGQLRRTAPSPPSTRESVGMRRRLATGLTAWAFGLGGALGGVGLGRVTRRAGLVGPRSRREGQGSGRARTARTAPD